MSGSTEPNRGEDRTPRRRALVQVNLVRALAAGALLAGLFAILFFVLLPDGGDGPVLPARMVETLPDAAGASPGVEPGRLARDFEASDLDGLRFRLSELRGRPVVINFWATWCPTCLAEMPVLEEQRRAHQADRLAVVAVNVGEGTDRARRFIEELELFDFAVAMDTDLTVADAYGIRGLPQSVFIDGSGVIQAVYQGQLDAETMARYVRSAIDAVPGGEPDFRLRIVNPVPRQHLLEVLPAGEEPGVVRFASRRFRCDDAYCAAAAVDRLRAFPGVAAVELRGDATPPALTVTFDPAERSREDIVATLTDILRAHPDPLYTQSLQVRYLQ